MKIQNQILKLMLTIVLAFSIFSCENEGNNEIITKLPTSNELINADLANYSVLRKGLEVAGLLNIITGNGAYTIFAPNNTAFAAYTSTNFATGINETVLTTLATAIAAATQANPLPSAQQAQLNELKRTLMYHVVTGAVFGSDLPNKNYIKTFAPYLTSTAPFATLSAYVDKTNGVIINGGGANTGTTVTNADIRTSNGVIHKIDSVIKLPTLMSQLALINDFSVFLTNLNADATAKGFVTAPANNTQLFVPLNDAFTNATGTAYLTGKTPAQIAEIIKFHITTGSNYSRNATVGIQGNQFQSDGAATATSYLPTTAVTDATVTTKTLTLVQPAPPAVATFQSFKIARNTLNAFEFPVLTGISVSKIKTTNIHTSNGIIHVVDRILQPVLAP